MLFLFRGHNGPLVRAIVGAVLLVVGIAVHGGAILVGLGAVLLVWGAIGALSCPAGRPPEPRQQRRSDVVSAIVVERLTKHFGDFAAVDGVSFEVPEGQLVAVLGPNGAGKTTTLEMLEGFLAPTSGTARVLDVDPHRGDRRWRARIGLVLQSTSLDAELTVRDTLTVFAGLYPTARPVGEVLELVDLVDDAETRVGVLSGGQRRRVDVAIGIVGRPEVLFLDEPTTGLDPEARRRAWTAVENLTTTGTTVVLTTHYIDEADHLANRLILLAGGKVIADTTPEGLRAQGGPATIRYHLPDDAPLGDLPATLTPHVDPARRALGRPGRRPHRAAAGPTRLGRPAPPRPLRPRSRPAQPRRRLLGRHRPTDTGRNPPMTDTTRPAQSRMPSIGRLLAAQIGYQARLLASGRAITIGIGFPIILLIASHQSHTHTTDADVAQYAVFGLTLTAWNTYGVRLVAAREAGILKRWWATPLPRWCYFLGRILATVVVATVAGAATVAAGVLLYNTHLTVSGALGALVVVRPRGLRLGRRRHRPHRRHPHARSGRADLPGHLLSRHHHLGRLRCHQRTALAVHHRQLPARPTPRPRRRQPPSGTPPATPGSPHATSLSSQLGLSPGWLSPSSPSAGSRTGPPSDARPVPHGRPAAPTQAQEGISATAATRRRPPPRPCRSGRPPRAMPDRCSSRSWS